MLMTPTLLAVCLLAQSLDSAPDLTVKQVLDRWEAGANLIDSYELWIELRTESFIIGQGGEYRLKRPDEPRSPILAYSHVFRSGSQRSGEYATSRDGPYSRKMVYDGTMLTSGSAERNTYDLQRNYFFFGTTQLEDYESLYRGMVGSVDRITRSRDRSARLLPRDGDLYVVDVPDAKTPGPWFELAWKVWLDPARNFLPVKMAESIVKQGRSLHDSDTTIELAEVEPGVWAPVAAHFVAYGKMVDSPLFGKVVGEDFLKVDRDRSRFNIAVPASQFVMTIPNGATVTDESRNVVYTQGASDPDAYLAKLADQGRQAAATLPKPTMIGMNPVLIPNQHFYWTTRRAVAAGVLSLGVVVLGWMASRTWRKRALG